MYWRNTSAVRGVVDCPALFLTIEDSRLSRKQVQNRISHYGLKARLEGVRCSPHTFRKHTFAKMCVQSGANVFELQQILGQRSLEMVRNYVNLFSSEVKELIINFYP